MSSVSELIDKLCPKGVEYKHIGDIGSFFSGLSGKSKEDFNDGNAKFITYMNVYSHPKLALDIDDKVKIGEGEKQHMLEKGDILFTGSSETPDECGMSSVVMDDVKEPCYLNSFCFGLRLFDKSLFDNGFLSHVFRSYSVRQQIARTANGVTRYNVSKKLFAKVQIPVPPIEVQQEIVCILDTFTNVIENLNRELMDRRKQYEYYSNILFGSDKQYQWMSVLDIADTFTGLTYKPSEISTEGTLVLRSSNIKGNSLSFEDNVFVDKDIPKRAVVKENDLLICVRNGSKKLVGKCAMINKDAEGMAFGAFMSILRPTKVNPRYLFHIWQSYIVKKQYMGDDAMPINQITKKDFARIKIPVPDDKEQKRVSSILDAFDSLITNISSEIRLRQKQYEYYRDQLLNFKRKV